MGQIEEQAQKGAGACSAHRSRWGRMRARVRQLLHVADWALTVLFAVGALFIGVLAVCLCFGAFAASPLLGVALALCSAALIYVLWSKKQRVGGLLAQAQAVVDGQVDRVADMLRDLVDEALSSVALSFAVGPGAMLAATLVAAMLGYSKLAVVLLLFAAGVAFAGVCVYAAVRYFAMTELERVIQGLKGGRDERTPLTAL